jgi:hypothetical protein
VYRNGDYVDWVDAPLTSFNDRLDPSGTDVSVRYQVRAVDSQSDPGPFSDEYALSYQDPAEIDPTEPGDWWYVDDTDPGDPGDPVGTNCSRGPVAVAGDSWAYYTSLYGADTALNQQLRMYGATSGTRVGITARDFVGSPQQSATFTSISRMVSDNPDCARTLVLSLGGNDVIDGATDQLQNDMANIVTGFLAADPGLRIVIPGYDLVNTSQTATCRALAAVFSGGDMDFVQINRVGEGLRPFFTALAATSSRVEFLDLAGSVQGRPGNPDYSVGALPLASYTSQDCIHLSRGGHEIFNEEIVNAIDPSAGLPGADRVTGAQDGPYRAPALDFEEPGRVLTPTQPAPYTGSTYNSMVIDYEAMHVNKQNDCNWCDDEIVLAVIEFQTTPGVAGSTSARFIDRGLTRLEGDQNRTRTIPDDEGRFVITGMEPSSWQDLQQTRDLPRVRGQMIVALEAEPAWSFGRGEVRDKLNELADQLVARLAPIVEDPSLRGLSSAGTQLLETDLLQRLIDAGLDAERSIDASNAFSRLLSNLTAKVVGYGVLLFFETPAGADDEFNPVFHEYFSEPVYGGAAGNSEFIMPMRSAFGDSHAERVNGGTWYEIKVQVEIGNNL